MIALQRRLRRAVDHMLGKADVRGDGGGDQQDAFALSLHDGVMTCLAVQRTPSRSLP